jgi:hypothetical protein
MKNWWNKTNISWGLLISAVVGVKIWSKHPDWVEDYYATGLYPYLSGTLRKVMGWLPVSFGDILYGAAGCYLIWIVIKWIQLIRRKKVTKLLIINRLKFSVRFLMLLYIAFNLLWGLNYNRLGIAHQLHIQSVKYSTDELKLLTINLLDSVNVSRKALGDSTYQYPHYRQVFDRAVLAYDKVYYQYPFLKLDNPSIKKSLFGRLGNWVGYLGYYNPFTGESQVNLASPEVLTPFVTCHEIAHQLGYASESEANFTGFLAATASEDPLFRYSCYFDMFHYANRELYSRDSIAAKNMYLQLDGLVKKDFKALRTYLLKHKNPVEPIIKAFYDQYLKANQQTNGVESYNEVTGWLIAYQKKYGKL